MPTPSLRVFLVLTVALFLARGGLAWQRHRSELAAAARLGWRDQPSGSAEARAGGRPLLYAFSAHWCAPCRALERDVFDRAEPAAWIGERFVAVRVEDGWDGDGLDDAQGRALRERLGVEAFPTLLVLREGREVGRLSGYPGADRVLEFLARHAAEGDGTP